MGSVFRKVVNELKVFVSYICVFVIWVSSERCPSSKPECHGFQSSTEATEPNRFQVV